MDDHLGKVSVKKHVSGHSEQVSNSTCKCNLVMAMDKFQLEDAENILDISHNQNTVGMAHSRWATHGAITKANAHPHMSQRGIFLVVHNGIITNYVQLKMQLQEENHAKSFRSETDSEVIANWLEYEYEKRRCSSAHSVVECIRSTVNHLEGSFGLVIMCTEVPNMIFCTRHGSPLLVAVDDCEAYISSEKSALTSTDTKINLISLGSKEICVLSKIKL